MFKFRPRRKSYYSNSYYRKSNRNRRFSLLWLILFIPLSIILLELLARILVGFTGNSGKAGESAIATAYRLKFLTTNQKPIEGLSDRGSLVATRSLSTSYQLQAQQKTEFWQINAQGFRDSDPIPLAKPKNEIRIFILGGSTAFGQWNKNNQETIASYLETLLRERVAQQKRSPEKYRPDVFPFFKPDRVKAFALPPKLREGEYRVINAAVPGYASGNQLAQLALQILPYQPDLVIILDGYRDLMSPSTAKMTDIPKLEDFLQNPRGHYQAYLNKSFHEWLAGTYIVQASQSLLFKSQPKLAARSLVVRSEDKSLDQYLPADEAELQLRVSRYQQNHQQMIRLCTASGILVVTAIQPEITGLPVNKLSPDEKAIRDQLGKNYTEKMPKAYLKLAQATQQLQKAFPNNVKVLDFYYLTQNFPSASFSDAIHLTAKANQRVAEQIYSDITKWQKIQIIPANFDLEKKSKK